jgi:alkylhydroperoxidase/carboxymuconolactone decarboxylase family protein YurZ
VTLGLLMGLANHEALKAHVPVTLRNGLTVPELEELVYQAATYLGYVSGAAI